MCLFNNFLKLKTPKYLFGLMNCLMAVILLCSFDFFSKDPVETEYKSIAVEGQLSGENILFDLKFEVQSGTDNKPLTLLKGDFALVNDDLGEAGVISVNNKELTVSFKKTKRSAASFLAVSSSRK